MMTWKRCIFLFAGLTCLTQLTVAQSLSMDYSTPESAKLGVEVCVSIELSHSGVTGYAPYIRLLIPPELDGSSISATFFGEELSTITFGGTASGGVVGDPLLSDDLPQNDVPAPDGYRLYTIAVPVGSMVDQSVPLPVNICLSMSQNAEVDVPFDVIAQSVYRLGNDPQGLNGPLIFGSQTSSVTPLGYSFSLSSSNAITPAGPCWPVEIVMSSDIATDYSLEDVTFELELPENLTFQSLAAATPGCFVTTTPSPGDVGGSLSMTCDNVFGTENGADIQLITVGYFADVTDANDCGAVSSIATGQMGIAGNFDQDGEVPFTVNHGALVGTVQADGLGLGGTANIGFEYKLEAYANFQDIILNTILPDGLVYDGTSLLNGSSISATSVTDLGQGQTELVFQLSDSDFTACSTGMFSFGVSVNTHDFEGNLFPVGSGFPVNGSFQYDIQGGAQDCLLPFGVGVGVPGIQSTKSIISEPVDGLYYSPGEIVTYQLSATIPPGANEGIIFEEILPLPIHLVTDISLVFGEDIRYSDLDNAGLNPIAITIDETLNKLFVEWEGDESLAERTIAIELDVPVSGIAFNGGLNHRNFCRFTPQGDGGAAAGLGMAPLQVGSSSLSLVKGISGSDNFDVLYAPQQFPVNAGASGVDSWDWIDYVITITNGGTAPAYDVVVNDFPPYPALQGCYVVNVENIVGDDVPFSGSLFESGLLVETIPSSALDPDGNRIFINYKCQVAGNALSQNQHINVAEATWASVPGGVDRFDPVDDQCQINIRRPEISLEIVDIAPGHRGNLEEVHVGEVITMHVSLTFPEGITRDANFECLLPQGLAFEDIRDQVADEGAFGYEMGNLNDVIDATLTESIGEGDENALRRLFVEFGDVLNVASDNNDPEQVEFDVRLVVTNAAAVSQNTELIIDGYLNYRKGSNSAPTSRQQAITMTAKEADLESSIDINNSSLDPGESTLATIQVEHSTASVTSAYDVQVVFDLPLGLTVEENSFLSECEELLSEQPIVNGDQIVIRWDSIPVGMNCEVAFNLQVLEDYPPCTDIDLCETVTWSSASSSLLDLVDYGPVGPISHVRTGFITDPGGELNDYRSEQCDNIEVAESNLSTPIISGNFNVCEGSTLQLSTQPYEGTNLQFEWTGPGVPDGYNNPQLIISDASELLNGMYELTVREGECISPASDAIEISIVQNPSVQLQDITLECTNGEDNLILQPIISGGNGDLEYAWTGPVGYVSYAPEALIPNVDSNDEGTYELQVTDQYGCTSNLGSALVEVSDAPEPPQITGDQSICDGDQLDLNCTSYPGMATYFWQLPNGTQVQSEVPSLSVEEVASNDDGVYSVYATVEGCETLSSAPIDITISPIPEAPEIAGYSESICEGEILALSTSATGDAFSWTGPNGFSSNLNTPPVIQNIDDLWSGEYTLTVTVNNCQSPFSTIDVDVIPRPDTPDLISNGPICQGDEMILSTPVNAEAYEWTLPGEAPITGISPSWNLPTDNLEGSQEFGLSIYDGTCWSLVNYINAQIDVIPNVEAFTDDEMLACPNTGIELTSYNDPQYTGVWLTMHDELEITSPYSPTTVVLGGNQGETYTFTWSLFNDGCGEYSQSEIQVQIPDETGAEEDYYEIVEGNVSDFYVMNNDPFNDLPTTIEIINFPNHGTASANSGEFIEYNATDRYDGPDELTYKRCLVACPDVCSETKVFIDVVPRLGIPDIITPNGDGVNDALRIEGLDRYPNHSLCIFNRWGRSIYEASPYDNTWEGTYEDGQLPSGTYFFVFTDLQTNQVLQQGYLTIQ